ncbi:MAG TPA: MATE family efflux transporter [Pelomicrobium sp.]|nr:MATE family efflux transporter [Pelomicrobium sp.]
MDQTLNPDLQRPARLPAVRYDALGNRHVDLRAMLALAWPMAVNSAIQAVLGLTDTWFVGQLSTDAVAAMGAVHFLAIVFIVLLGGTGLAVQPMVAQAYGARRSHRASSVVWLGAWCTLLTAPAFIAAALTGSWILAPFGLAPPIEGLALEYWLPRLLGGPVAVLLWGTSAFFNGIGRPTVSLLVAALVAVVNVALNELLIFRLGWGMAGAGWATTLAMTVGVGLVWGAFLAPSVRKTYRSHLTWRPSAAGLRRVLAFGLPAGVFAAVDLAAFAVFQLMQSAIGAVDGAATQIVMALTSLAYMPAFGFALAGTTLVGQSIGAGDRDWAFRVGNASILLQVVYMGALAVLLALAGPWLLSWFVSDGRPDAAAVMRLGTTLLWIAAAYQVFDALNMGAGFCLRGAGDVRVPTVMLFVLAWLGFVPLAHALSFAPGEGWVDFLPQFGLGALGGWLAALAYIVVIGLALLGRWRSGAWRAIRIG